MSDNIRYKTIYHIYLINSNIKYYENSFHIHLINSDVDVI